MGGLPRSAEEAPHEVCRRGREKSARSGVWTARTVATERKGRRLASSHRGKVQDCWPSPAITGRPGVLLT